MAFVEMVAKMRISWCVVVCSFEVSNYFCGLRHCSDATRIFIGCQYGLVYEFGYGLVVSRGVHILRRSIMLIGTLLGIQR